VASVGVAAVAPAPSVALQVSSMSTRRLRGGAGEAANISMATRNGFIEGSPRSIRRTPSRSSRGLIMPSWSTSSAAKNSDVMAAPAAGSSLPSKSDGRGIPS